MSSTSAADDTKEMIGSQAMESSIGGHEETIQISSNAMNSTDPNTQLKEISDKIDKIISEGGDLTGNAKSTGKSTVPTEPLVDVSKLNDFQLIQYLKEQELKKQREKELRRALKGKDDLDKEHRFWNTQPMPALSEQIIEGNGPIDESLTTADIRVEPFNMPAGFTWCNIDVNDDKQALELYTLLNENYVEDDDCVFRFDYSVDFLRWALTPPGYVPDWIVGVRNIKTGSLFGCITAVPVEVNVGDTSRAMAEINFLCVHKKLRTKRLAPVLIKEITRRVNLLDRWQAVYTAGVVLPKPIGRCRYYHRTLNAKKLVEIRFTYIPQKMTLAGMIKNLQLAKVPAVNGLRAMEAADIPQVFALLMPYLQSKGKLYQRFTPEELGHVLLPRVGVVNTYIVENAQGIITDFCSYYHLPSTVIGNEKYKKLNAVYSYYNVATSMHLTELMRASLILARNDGADVFNALDLLENSVFMNELKFGIGDGHLQYYVYNWKCPELQPNEIGMVLL